MFGATMPSFSTSHRFRMAPPRRIHMNNLVGINNKRFGSNSIHLGDGETDAVTSPPAVTSDSPAAANVPTVTAPAMPVVSFWNRPAGRVTLVAGGATAGYLLHCLMYRRKR